MSQESPFQPRSFGAPSHSSVTNSQVGHRFDQLSIYLVQAKLTRATEQGQQAEQPANPSASPSPSEDDPINQQVKLGISQEFLEQLPPEVQQQYLEYQEIASKGGSGFTSLEMMKDEKGQTVDGSYGMLFKAFRDEQAYALKYFKRSPIETEQEYKASAQIGNARASYIPLISKALNFTHMPMAAPVESVGSEGKSVGYIAELAAGQNADTHLFLGNERNLNALKNVNIQHLQDTLLFDMLFQYQDGWASQYMIDPQGNLTKIDNEDYKLAEGSIKGPEYSSSYVAGLPNAHHLLTEDTKAKIEAIQLEDLESLLKAATYLKLVNETQSSKDDQPSTLEQQELFKPEKIERAKRNLLDLKALIQESQDLGGISGRQIFNLYNARSETGELDPNNSTLPKYQEHIEQSRSKRHDSSSTAAPSQIYNYFGSTILGQTAQQDSRRMGDSSIHDHLAIADQQRQQTVQQDDRQGKALDETTLMRRVQLRRSIEDAILKIGTVKTTPLPTFEIQDPPHLGKGKGSFQTIQIRSLKRAARKQARSGELSNQTQSKIAKLPEGSVDRKKLDYSIQIGKLRDTLTAKRNEILSRHTELQSLAAYLKQQLATFQAPEALSRTSLMTLLLEYQQFACDASQQLEQLNSILQQVIHHAEFKKNAEEEEFRELYRQAKEVISLIATETVEAAFSASLT